MGGKNSRGGGWSPFGFPDFSVLYCCQKKSHQETPLGFCSIKDRRSQLCFGTQDPAYLDVAYFPDNDLHMAACAGDLPFVRLYFNLGKYEINHRDKENRTAMHFACFYGHLDMVRYLWRRGCEINARDNRNITPLMKAVQSWEEEIVHFLLDHHANPHIKDHRGNTALHYAVYAGNSATAARLLKYGADIEERTKDNLTPLLLALRENRLMMAQFLVKMEASVHAVDSHRRNSLMYAVRCDSPAMVNLILQQGVDTNFKDLFGWTASRYATEGDREVYKNLCRMLKKDTDAHENGECTSGSSSSTNHCEMDAIFSIRCKKQAALDKEKEKLRQDYLTSMRVNMENRMNEMEAEMLQLESHRNSTKIQLEAYKQIYEDKVRRGEALKDELDRQVRAWTPRNTGDEDSKMAVSGVDRV
ncbi:ankyrin repeat domain-containing protein 7-like [Acomys russatus]|uniref:ankyrin repeat domain-containing protein 7-like n=1 Tax=Acomys russatus TaxID=60746 RepID=UPI0021E22509|nr:ankyrin repeat domain-containing protein 7-like [Acomys russatus]